ncbi:hypothetical protein Cni_G22338 [Canna indica]|uniref:Oryzain alpha chain n=1 Tax=Canna indica TaxID=4628 RepID=A0AAQ3KUY6_9LILI|nr:hypothetical protein Cni_G22338 [Canna indica]
MDVISKSFIAVVVLLGLAAAAAKAAPGMSLLSNEARLGDLRRSEEEVRRLYEQWMAKHGRSYKSLGEKEKRFEVFKDNLRFIDAHNAAADAGEHGFRLGVNCFADLTNEEYRATYLASTSSAAARQERVASHRYLRHAGDELPSSVDWRAEGAVALIKDQGNCGSSWAFATIAAVESINKIVTGKLIKLSEQVLVDCDNSYNLGCSGGIIDYAFAFIIGNGGINTDDDYPYKGHEGKCDWVKKNTKVVSIDGFEDVPANNEKALQKAVAHQPVSVAIDAGGREFQLYQSGVFTGRCGTQLNHGAVIVGYDTDNDRDYWIVRNSCGEDWGELGYIRMERNVNTFAGQCGIAMRPSYPTKKGHKPGPCHPCSANPPTVCNSQYSCPSSTTCCCVYENGDYCYAWGCCPFQAAVCCKDHYSCCPRDYPFCNVQAGTCHMSKDNPLGVKALTRSPAKPYWWYSGIEATKSSM